MTAIGGLRIAALLALGVWPGCGPGGAAESSDAAGSEPAPQLRTRAYDCEDVAVVASFSASDAVDLFLPEQSLRLPRVRSASGAKYAGEGIVFWTKGSEALLEQDGRSRSCREDPVRSIWEDAKLRGVDFRAVGNEPGWVLEIGPEEILFEFDYGATRARFPLVEPRIDVDGRRTVYELRRDGSARIAIEGRRCLDSMADVPAYEATVEVVLDDRGFRGCGRPLY